MDMNWQSLKLLLLATAGVALCCQCQTNDSPEIVTSLDQGSKFGKLGKVNKVGLKRESGYKFTGVNDNELASSGKKSEAADRVANTLRNEKVIKNRKGEVVRVEKRSDLYGDRSSNSAQEGNRAFDGRKKAKFKDSNFARKEFKTPEYLQRQEFAGTKTFKDGNRSASESGSESRQFVKKLFKTGDSSFQNQSARENGSSSSRFNKSFKTSNDRIASKALNRSAIPEGVQGMTGYQDNLLMSMDDVKKLVNPSSAR